MRGGGRGEARQEAVGRPGVAPTVSVRGVQPRSGASRLSPGSPALGATPEPRPTHQEPRAAVGRAATPGEPQGTLGTRRRSSRCGDREALRAGGRAGRRERRREDRSKRGRRTGRRWARSAGGAQLPGTRASSPSALKPHLWARVSRKAPAVGHTTKHMRSDFLGGSCRNGDDPPLSAFCFNRHSQQKMRQPQPHRCPLPQAHTRGLRTPSGGRQGSTWEPFSGAGGLRSSPGGGVLAAAPG